MAMRDVDRFKKEAARLTPDEQRRLAHDLLKMANVQKVMSGEIDELAGTIHLAKGPLEIQREMRAD